MSVDPLKAMEVGFGLLWDGVDVKSLSFALQLKYYRDVGAIEKARAVKAPTNYLAGDFDVSNQPSVSTANGNFTKALIDDLRKTLDKADAEGMDRDQVVMWQGQQVVIAYGRYLVEYVEMELAKRPSGHGGL